MNTVFFPSLNLKIELNKIAFRINDIDIYWYGLFIVFSIIIAILLCKKDDGKYNIKFDNILELILIVIPISFICARIYYVIFNLDYYKSNIYEIFNIKQGGLAIYGGIIGGAITIYIYCKIKKINLLDVLDYIVPYLPLGQAIGRWGNFFNIEAYGIETNSFFRMGIIENEKYIEVHPTFFYESIFNILIFIILIKMKNKRKYKGEVTYVYLLLYSLIRAFIEGIRSDSLMVGNYRISQIISIIIFVIFSIILLINKKERKENEI